jgi:hypothetical protein
MLGDGVQGVEGKCVGVLFVVEPAAVAIGEVHCALLSD